MVASGGWRVFFGLWVLVGSFSGSAQAAVSITPDQNVIFSGTGLSEVVPDGGALTVGDTLSGYAHLPENFYEISVSFRLMPDVGNPNPQLSTMVSGDYRVLLRHGSGIGTPDTVGSFLLQNVGQEFVFPQMGYWDSGGMDITFEDSARDSIQAYRTVVTGDHMTEFAGVLEGTWRPLESMAPLGVGDPNGSWSLIFEDSIPGGQGKLESWSIRLKAVPEASSASLVMVAIGLGLLNRHRRRGSDEDSETRVAGGG